MRRFKLLYCIKTIIYYNCTLCTDVYQDSVDEIGLFVAEGRQDDKESDVFKDSQLLGFIFTDGGCLVDGAIVTADVQVRGLVLLDENNKKLTKIQN